MLNNRKNQKTISNKRLRVVKYFLDIFSEILFLIMKKTLFYLLLLFIIFSCKEQKPHDYTFYYWKTKLALNQAEKAALEKAGTPYIYTRFFDVDKIDGKFQPVAVATKNQSFETHKKIIPVIFITNRTFLYIKKEEIKFLAENIFKMVEKKTDEFRFENTDEIQIDCDWTAGTQNDYFEFLKELQTISKKKITSTLRLHQVKNKDLMGIPPVEKVYLMCYSTSSPLENSGKNSILDAGILKNYLSDLGNYPIKKIDVALPIYSWGIITNHLGKHKLINALNAEDLKNPGFEKISENEITVKKDGFYFGHFLNKGFKIRTEQITDEQLDEVIEFLNQKKLIFNIIYYQLDGKFIENRKFKR